MESNVSEIRLGPSIPPHRIIVFKIKYVIHLKNCNCPYLMGEAKVKQLNSLKLKKL